MNGYCLRNGRLLEARPEDVRQCSPEAAFLLTADGELRPLELRPLELRPFSPPELGEGEGLLLYGGEFRVEPLEIQIEFMKAVSAEKWLEALVLRHVERMRDAGPELWALAVMKEVYE